MISICMATYNGEQFILQQLQSILMQLSLDDEVVISDDGSSDKTIEVILSLNDPRIKLITHEREWLPSNTPILSRVKKNFEQAIIQANGDYIFLSDQDDIWNPKRVKKTTQYMDSETNLIICNCEVVDQDEGVLFSSYFDLVKPSSNFLRTLFKSSYHGCCMCFKGNIKDKILPFPIDDIGHDIWIGIICSIYGKVKFIDEPLLKYRRHNKTVTESGFRSNRHFSTKIMYRYIVFKEIRKRIAKNA